MSGFLMMIKTNQQRQVKKVFENHANKWFKNLYDWLFKCEKIFGLTDLKGYGLQRIYTFLTERYMPFWFEKYSKVGYWPWIFTDISKIKD